MLREVFLISALCVGAAAILVNRLAGRREDIAEAANPPTGQIVPVNGTDIHFKVDGTGPPLVLLHGAGGNLRDFDPLIPALEQNFTVVRFDRPGLGWSELPAGYGNTWRDRAPSPSEQAQVLHQLYQTLGLGPALVLGHSFGGAVALAWAIEHPDDTTGLVLASAVSNPWTGDLHPLYPLNAHPLGAAFLVPMITAFSGKKQIDATLEAIFTPQEPPATYASLIGAGLSMRREALRANARQVNGLLPHMVEMVKSYGTLKLPVEIVHGEADAVVPMDIHAVPLRAQIANANLTRLPGIGHMPHHVAPETIVSAIKRAAERADMQRSNGEGDAPL